MALNRQAVRYGGVLALCAGLAAGAAHAVSTAEWRQVRFQEFDEGSAEGVAITSRGALVLAPHRETIAAVDENFVWDLAVADDGTVFAATGNDGKVLRLSKDGEVSVFLDSDEPEILSVALGPAGEVYAGTSPNGIIYKISARGEARELCRTGENHVWALVLDERGNLYAGTGPGGKILRVSPRGKLEEIYDSNQAHILCLVTDGKKYLYGGSEPDGIVYRVSLGRGDVSVLYDADETDIHALALDDAGTLYAGTAGGARPGAPSQPSGGAVGMGGPSAPDAAEAPPVAEGVEMPAPLAPEAVVTGPGDAGMEKETAVPAAGGNAGKTMPPPAVLLSGDQPSKPNAVYRITADGIVRKVFQTKRFFIFGLACDDAGNVYAATGNEGRVYRIDTDQEAALLVSDPDGSKVLAIERGRGADTLLVIGTSDAAVVARVKRAPAPTGTFVSTVWDCSLPVAWGALSWSAKVPRGAAVEFSTRSGNTGEPDDTWEDWAGELRRSAGSGIVSSGARFVQYRVKLTAPRGGQGPEVRDVRLSYLPANLAPAVSSLTVVPPGGGTMMPGGGKPAQGGAASSGGGNACGRSYRVGWQAGDPNGDALSYGLFFRGVDEENWKTLEEDLEKTSYCLDGESLADGYYHFRVVASDSPANPAEDAKRDEWTSEPVLVDTTAPRVEQLRGVVNAGGELVVTGRVVDDADRVAGILLSVDAGDWELVFPVDRIFDSSSEEFRFTARGPKGERVLEKGEHVVSVKVTDRSGNTGAAKEVVRVE